MESHTRRSPTLAPPVESEEEPNLPADDLYLANKRLVEMLMRSRLQDLDAVHKLAEMLDYSRKLVAVQSDPEDLILQEKQYANELAIFLPTTPEDTDYLPSFSVLLEEAARNCLSSAIFGADNAIRCYFDLLGVQSKLTLEETASTLIFLPVTCHTVMSIPVKSVAQCQGVQTTHQEDPRRAECDLPPTNRYASWFTVSWSVVLVKTHAYVDRNSSNHNHRRAKIPMTLST
ncbi:hypothetical protein PHYBOEH_006112 [Phytophthora boehmeriae]|uniref:Uncharacterized protein n=1 Tax=Phytophthora boehmeriae TaxID=109152 RepID=A0A8T1X333_9STRA|nr:hypothetical protein PHYBOEH_006112 [Phytophthora boehmeriae]